MDGSAPFHTSPSLNGASDDRRTRVHLFTYVAADTYLPVKETAINQNIQCCQDHYLTEQNFAKYLIGNFSELT